MHLRMLRKVHSGAFSVNSSGAVMVSAMRMEDRRPMVEKAIQLNSTRWGAPRWRFDVLLLPLLWMSRAWGSLSRVLRMATVDFSALPLGYSAGCAAGEGG